MRCKWHQVALEIFRELLDRRLNRPRSGITERAERFAFDVVAQIKNQLRIFRSSLTASDAFENFDEPIRAFTTGRAPATGFVLVQFDQILRCLEGVNRLV